MSEVSGEPAVDIEVTSVHEAKPEPKEDTAKIEPEAKADEKDQGNTDEVKPKRGGFQKKIEKLSTTLEQERAEKEAALAELARYRAGEPSKKPDNANGEPKEDDFETYGEYVKAQARFEARQEFKTQQEQERKSQGEKQVRETYQAKIGDYRQKAAEYAQTQPDFDERVSEYMGSGYVTQEVEAAVIDSDMGPQVAYYLATHPEEAMALDGKGIVAINKAIGKIEAKLEGQKSSPVRTTKAPPPIDPVKNQASTSKRPEDMTQREYEAWRGF